MSGTSVPPGVNGPGPGPGPVPDLATLAAGFGARLRRAGLPVGPERTTRFAAAVDLVRPDTTDALYWCALATLVADPADVPAFDAAFMAVFGARPGQSATRPERPATATAPPSVSTIAAIRSGTATARREEEPGEELAYGVLAATAERLRHRDFATLSAAELAALAPLMRRLRLATPLRRSRRQERHPRGGHIDLRTTLRQAQRAGGYPVRLARRRPGTRRRRLVVLCDISGSMQPYTRALLQLLYCARLAGRTEVFAFATRLTRLTRTLERSRPDRALARAGQAAPDWAGGTRIGAAVKSFVDRYGQRGMARGAVVLVISDGWEIGDATLLGASMARLSRLAHRVVWANPRTASPRYQPLVAGMAAAWPYCDAVVSAHSLDALDALVAALSGTGRATVSS
jgi:uncharacterized protein with von Willebrand factor type A (vWA) domain